MIIMARDVAAGRQARCWSSSLEVTSDGQVQVKWGGGRKMERERGIQRDLQAERHSHMREMEKKT